MNMRRVGWASKRIKSTAMAASALLLMAMPASAEDVRLYATPVLNLQSDIVSFHAYEDHNANGVYDGEGEDPNWWATSIDVAVFEGRAPVYSVVAHSNGTTEAISLLPRTLEVQAGYSGIMSGCAFGTTKWVAAGGAEYTIFINMRPCPAS